MKTKHYNMNMKIKNTILMNSVLVFASPVIIVLIVLFVPYALFRGLTDDHIINDYVQLSGRVFESLFYPITYIKKMNTNITTEDEMQCELNRYKALSAELENELNKTK